MEKITLDTSGLNCPLPVLKAKKQARSLSAGDLLMVIATDPASKIDFGHFCHTDRHKLLDQSEEEGVFTYLIEIGSSKEG